MEHIQGVYVLTDNAFRPFSRMSASSSSQAVALAQPVRPFTTPHSLPLRHLTSGAAILTERQFLWFPCGVVQGALAALGIPATVHAETSELPSAVFQIKTLQAKT